MNKKCQKKCLYWNPEEDELLQKLLKQHGTKNWFVIGQLIPDRSGKSCRLRWCDQLSSKWIINLLLLKKMILLSILMPNLIINGT
ncbi:hypothetical protein EJD97_020996 [Solanum chilense]|uniref:Uncharacterized protein n=1 Tax=Solanum chilense TaxID=4083 RepID=A0A6N2AYM5_SOLCI|nr:hypothetical protein EJD97_020996 [Solanum chilense]